MRTEKYKVKWYNVLFVILGMWVGVFIWIVSKCIEAVTEGVHRTLD